MILALDSVLYNVVSKKKKMGGLNSLVQIPRLMRPARVFLLRPDHKPPGLLAPTR